MVQAMRISKRHRIHGLERFAQRTLDSNALVLSERQLIFLRESVAMVLDQFVEGDLYTDAGYAYDSGLASGFYGKDSAIAKGLRRWFAQRLWRMRQEGVSRRHLRKIVTVRRVGMTHGAHIREGMPRVGFS